MKFVTFPPSVINITNARNIAALALITFSLAILIITPQITNAAVIDEVKTTVDAINTRTKTINNNVSTIKSQTNLIDNVQATTQDVQGKLQDLPTTIQSTLGIEIDPEMKDEILSTIAELRDAIQQQKAQLLEFGDGSTGTDCYNFKQDVKTLLIELLHLAGSLEALGSASLPTAPIEEIEVIIVAADLAPCKLLLPAYLAFEITLIPELVNRLSQSNDAVATLLPLFEISEAESPTSRTLITTNVGFGNRFYYPEICEDIHASPAERKRFGNASLSATISGAALEQLSDKVSGDPSIAGTLRPPNLVEILGSKTGGVHGYGMIELKKPKSKRQKWGKLIKGAATALQKAAESADQKILLCDTYNNQRVLLAQQCALTRYRSDACQAIAPQ